MAIGQSQANRILGRYEDRIAELLGIPVPEDLTVHVVSQAEIDRVFPPEGGRHARGYAGNHNDVYVTEDIGDIAEAARVIAYEAAHSMAMGPGTATGLGANGLTGGKAGKASEALSGVVLYQLGLQPPDWKPDPGAQTKLMKLRPEQLATVGAALREGTFTSVNELATAAGTGITPPADNGPPNQGQSIPTDTNSGGNNPPTTLPGGAPPPPPPPEDTGTSPADYRAGFLATLNSWQIPTTPNLMQLVAKASANGWSLDRFQNWVMKTPEFHDAFPGIYNADGTLKMDPSTYISTVKDYENVASSAGVNVNPGTVAWAIHHDVSASEFADRAQALRQLQSNPQLYNQFGKALVQEGKAAPGDITDQALTRYIMGKGNADWQDTWDLASARYAATQAGLTLQKGMDKYLAVNPNLIQKIANRGLSQDVLTQGFQEMAQSLLNDVPLAKIQGYGLSKKDVATAAFGGKTSANVKATIEKIHAQELAFNSYNIASTQGYADANGNVGEIGNATQRRAQTG